MEPRKTITAAALALVVAMSPAAFAKQKNKQKSKHQNNAGDIYSQYDANGDGRISRYEFPADPLLFDRADLNGDGVLTRGEAETFVRSTNVDSELRRLDRNGDGAISRSEWRGDWDAFARLDRNGDGVLSQADRTNNAAPLSRTRSQSRRRGDALGVARERAVVPRQGSQRRRSVVGKRAADVERGLSPPRGGCDPTSLYRCIAATSFASPASPPRRSRCRASPSPTTSSSKS